MDGLESGEAGALCGVGSKRDGVWVAGFADDVCGRGASDGDAVVWGARGPILEDGIRGREHVVWDGDAFAVGGRSLCGGLVVDAVPFWGALVAFWGEEAEGCVALGANMCRCVAFDAEAVV